MFRYLNILFRIYIFRYRKAYKEVRYLIYKMRLLSQISREYKGKEYKKFWIVIPQKLIEKLGWKTGQDLDGEIKKGKLLIEKD